MASDRHKRKPLLYSDLFKSHKSMAAEKEEEEDINVISKPESSIWSTSSNPSSSWDDSFLSDFSTPLYSDLGSIEGEISGDCFGEEGEEEEHNRLVNDVDFADYDAIIHNFANGLSLNPPPVEGRTPPIQVYELKNQPSISKQSPVLQGKRVNGTESAQQHNYMQYRGIKSELHDSGSVMQAVFLGGSGSRTGSSGTGVFLPRGTKDQAKLKRKSGGCSMVLIPTRVLQTLDLHFSRLQDSAAPPSSGGSLDHSCPEDEPTESNKLEKENLPEEDDVEICLPQEWTY